jgi:hypothetical protein
MKRMSPLALMAESMFREKRRPVVSTSGVSPLGAQVVPA